MLSLQQILIYPIIFCLIAFLLGYRLISIKNSWYAIFYTFLDSYYVSVIFFLFLLKCKLKKVKKSHFFLIQILSAQHSSHAATVFEFLFRLYLIHLCIHSSFSTLILIPKNALGLFFYC